MIRNVHNTLLGDGFFYNMIKTFSEDVLKTILMIFLLLQIVSNFNTVVTYIFIVQQYSNIFYVQQYINTFYVQQYSNIFYVQQYSNIFYVKQYSNIFYVQEKRLYGKHCLTHPWLSSGTDLVQDTVLETAKMRSYMARNRWNKAFKTIRATIRMRRGLVERSSVYPWSQEFPREV